MSCFLNATPLALENRVRGPSAEQRLYDAPPSKIIDQSSIILSATINESMHLLDVAGLVLLQFPVLARMEG